jgi:protein ImuB
MRRTACVDLPAFPLQLLLRRHPEWREHPAAVVESDRPQAKILWVNERARTHRILPGMRYAAGLSLAGTLRAAEVSPNEIEREVEKLGARLRRFTPHVEPAAGDPGAFWLDASGLERLHPSLAEWAEGIRHDLAGAGLESSLVVGFRRFGTYALAKARRPGVLVLPTDRDEHHAARRVALDRLTLDPEARDTLHKLGARTVGAFLDLPPEGIRKRFGREAYRLHRLAAGELGLPVQAERPVPPAQQRQILDHPESAVPRLMPWIERMIEPLLATLAERGHALARIHVGFRFERLGDHIEKITPAAPTLEADQLLELIRLRLEALRRLPDVVGEVRLLAESLPATRDQLRLFAERPKRDFEAGGRALARLRAELGESAVTRARLREGHLPEARFTWEPITEVLPPKPREVDRGRLVRRIFARPVPLPSRARHEPDGWMLRGLQQGPVVKVQGPFIVSGGWWRRTVHREYHFAETQKGELLWVYYDRPRRRWFLQGRVE